MRLPSSKTRHVILVTSRTPYPPPIPCYTPQTLGNFMQSTTFSSQKVENVLDYMKTKHVAFGDVLFYVLDGQSPRCASYRRWVFDDLESTLAQIDQYKRGREILRNWSLNLVCKVVDREMRKVKKVFAMNTREITPEFVEAWSFSGFRDAIKANAPTLCEVLLAGVQTARARNEGKKDPMVVRVFHGYYFSLVNAMQVISVIISQMAHHRSHYAMQFQALLGLFWWSSGASRQSIHTLQRCGLSISYDSINNILSELSPKCLAEAQPIARSSHLATYDNINISLSSFYEQREDAPSKVQSGTVAVLYKLRNANPDHMGLQELLNRDREGRDLHFSEDIQPSLSQLGCIQRQLSLHVAETSVNWVPEFSHYKSHPDLQHEQRRSVPRGYKTQQFPLRVSTIEENSIKGNIAVLRNIYVDQLGLTEDDFSDLAIPCINDQSTNARIRGAKAVRTDDVNSFTRIQCFQLAPGLFHMLMNLLWAILHVHRGSINSTGSLTYWFSVLDRKRLSSPQPDFHTLRSSLFQILDGLLLACWTTELNKRGHPNFTSFAASQPSPDELRDIASDIVGSYAKPDDASLPPPPHTKKAPDQNEKTASRFRNVTALIRDLLYVRELSTAISSGDWGRIEDILGTLAIVFKGAGASNYCTEVLHLIRNLKVVWTPEFA